MSTTQPPQKSGSLFGPPGGSLLGSKVAGKQATAAESTPEFGRITQVIGPVVDVEFLGKLP
ncbi:MAG TPA: hypothetical protein ENJ18_07275, partial [Nannocystis exedens]|nr:hypothetical protein [Nannocystis exedens]